MANLVDRVAETVRAYGDSTAIGFEGEATSYEEFWERTGGFAAALATRGIGEDDRVAIYLPNVPPFLVAFHGTLRAGGVVVPMNPQYKTREIGYLLEDSGATVVVAAADLVPFVDEVRDETDVERVVSVGGDAEGATPFEEFQERETLDVVARDDDDVAVQPYTSGTTGRPKGVQLTHRNLESNADMADEVTPDGVRPDDKQLGVLPLFHSYGMTVVMNVTLFNGGTYYAVPQWDAREVAAIIDAQDLTIMHGVPTMYNDLVTSVNGDAFDLSSLRFCEVGGSGIPAEVLRAFEDRYDGTLYEGYGLTEASPLTHANTPTGGRRVGSIGKPVPGVRSRIVDENFEELPPVEEGPIDGGDADLAEVTGEIVVSGPNVAAGYDGLPEATAEAFTRADGRTWLHTGDLGCRDEDGFFYVVDREKHAIVTGGYTVYPREVEELLFEHEAVADATVAGVSDERRGETVKAYVVPASAASEDSSDASGERRESDGVPTSDAEVTADEIKEYCLVNLAEYKHPREVEFVEELPRTTTGKVQKFRLREQEDETALEVE